MMRDFTDHPKREPERDHIIECPSCLGHGGWNIKLNAYPLPDDTDDTPLNRHLFCHFRASCTACWGWGYLRPGDCAHEFDRRWHCKKCDRELDVDSSG